MTRVLIATDGSDHAIAAAATADRVFGDDADFVVLSVATSPGIELARTPTTAFTAPVVTTHDGVRQAMLDDAEAAVRSTQSALNRPAKDLVVAGDVGPTICTSMEGQHADICVVGARGLGPVRRTLLGSVSDYVAHHATSPVLIVPPPADTEEEQ